MVRPNVLAMKPYSPGKPIEEVQREFGLSRVVKLASNENPLGPSPKAIEAMRAASLQVALYPDGASHDLRSAIAERFDFPFEQVVLGAGSDELLQNIGLALLSGPQDEVLSVKPTFSQYRAAANLAGASYREVPLGEDFAYDLVAVAAAISPNTKIVYLANPNNPTGTKFGRAALERFLDLVPEETLVVLDEAYFEFAAEDPEYPDGRTYAKQGRNVAALRTFSKAHGLAGLRLGYGFLPAYLADALNRLRSPFNINLVAQAAGLASLADEAHVAATLKSNHEGREQIESALREAGGRPIRSYANFVFADMGRPARPIFEALLREGAIIRPGDVFGEPNYLRVSIGTADENSFFAAALRKVCADLAVC